MPPPPPPPPRATSSPAPAPPRPFSPSESPSLSRPSTPPLSTLALSSSIGPSGQSKGGKTRKGDTLSLAALMSDLGVLTSMRGEGLLAGADGKKEGTFAPAPPPADAYAPQPPSYALADLSAVDLATLSRDQAVRLAEEWVAATGRVLARAEGELERAGEGEGRGKVERAEEVRGWAREVGRGLEVA
ncbi:hypothetical protein JCM6882_005179 [Rhodosporidiobolus microsporus]